MVSRRRVLGAIGGAGGTALLAGCAGLTGPNPQVRDDDMEQNFLGALTGTGTVEVLVENDGQEGQVEVVVELEDNHGEVVTREIESVHMEEGEQRRISVDVEVTEAVEAYEVEARAA